MDSFPNPNSCTRLWEFLAGVLLALILKRVTVSARVARVAGWAGLAAMLSFAAFFDLSALLPGYMSLVPVLAAAGIIVSAKAKVEPQILLAKPVLWFANSSFAFYLWHWPILVFYRWRVDDNVSLLAGLGILSVSALLAVATTRLFEDPFRRWTLLAKRPLLSLFLSLVLLLPPAAATWQWQLELRGSQVRDAQAIEDYRSEGNLPPPGETVPSTLVAKGDLSSSYETGCHQNGTDPEIIECFWGDHQGAERKIVVAGGSHENQWLDVAIEAANEQGVSVAGYTKSNCPYGDNEMAASLGQKRDPSCGEWSKALQEKLLADPPDVLVAMGTRTEDGTETIPEWKLTYFSELINAGIPVVAIRDNPRFEEDVVRCVELKGASECSIDAESFFTKDIAGQVPDHELFHFVDLESEYCPEGICTVIQDQVLVYRDTNHLTRTWTLSRGAPVRDAIVSALEMPDAT